MADQKRHVTFQVKGIPVTFPYEPYDIQREFVASVIEAANTSQNALLESPTGTGKTLSLLCSSLAWQQQQSAKVKHMIYYTSRTHIQLNQAAKEMKKTAYAGTPAVVLGSRVHMCINNEVKGQSDSHAIGRACHNAIAKDACPYFKGYEQRYEQHLDPNKVYDIEDLHEFGKSKSCCPYYVSRKLAEDKASVVFMPYNYLLDLSIQKHVKLRVDNSILIFDEGHNIESAFKESASGKFTKNCLAIIQESCHKLPSKLSDALTKELHGLNRYGYDPQRINRGAVVDEFKIEAKSRTKKEEKEPKVSVIEELAAILTNDRLQQVNKSVISLESCQDMLKSFKGMYEDTKCSIEAIYNKMDQAGVNYRTSDLIMTTLDAMSTFWSIAGVMSVSLVAKYLGAISDFKKFLSIMFPSGLLSLEQFITHRKRLDQYYAAYLIPEFEKQSIFIKSNDLVNWGLNLWCLHPAHGLKRVVDEICARGPRSLIITSGTLTPMNQIKVELEMDFKIVKDFEHLISKEQFEISIIGTSPNRYNLQSTHKDTEKPRYPLEVGETLLRLFKVLPFGTLVFFSSYSLLDKVMKYCKSSQRLWDLMTKATTIFCESQNQSSFSDDLIGYKKVVDSGKRAVFIGVFRGKLSEGTNLEGNHCRSVIIIGMPYPALKDPRVVETKIFQARRGDLDGATWYRHQMCRALGQAIGRVIRSKNDFGMLFLCDPRFSHLPHLSKWVKRFYPEYVESNYENLILKVRDFFARHDIDISAVCIADANESSQGAFEFDTAKSITRMIGRQRPLHDGSRMNNENTKTSCDTQIPTSDREDKMKAETNKFLSQYSVDPETYRKAQEKRRPPVGDPGPNSQPKKVKNGFSEKVWQISGREVNDLSSDEDEVVEVNRMQYDLPPPHPRSNSVSKTAQELTSKPAVGQPKAKTKSKNIFASRKPQNNQPKVSLKACYICFKADAPLFTKNCSCAFTCHKKCATPLNNKFCEKCGVKIKIKNFKELLFG